MPQPTSTRSREEESKLGSKNGSGFPARRLTTWHVSIPMMAASQCAMLHPNRINGTMTLVLFGMQSRNFGPYLAAINRILI
jgi:hypothetical protein